MHEHERLFARQHRQGQVPELRCPHCRRRVTRLLPWMVLVATSDGGAIEAPRLGSRWVACHPKRCRRSWQFTPTQWRRLRESATDGSPVVLPR